MKNLTYIFILFIATAFITSCESDLEKTVIGDSPVAPALGSPSSLEFVKGGEPINFTWSESDFGFAASVTYTVEMSLTDDFAVSSSLASTGDLAASVSIGDINSVLLAWELPIDESAAVKLRVVASVSDQLDPITSIISDFTSTPYETLIDYPMIYVPGAHQGWSPGELNGRLFSYGFDNVYEGIIRVIDGADPTSDVGFKVTPRAEWVDDWGGALASSGSNYAGTMSSPGDNFNVAPGVYEFSVDVSAETIELTRTDDWGIIGHSTPTGWDSDTDMFYNGQREMWEITMDLVAGAFKFRANDAWDLNLGGNDLEGSSTVDGDGNIVVDEAGNYTVRLDLTNSKYTVSKN